MVFGPSALNRVYNFKRVCPGPVLDRGVECLERRYSAFILVNNASRQLSFHLRFTAVNAIFWDFSPFFLGSVSFICCDWYCPFRGCAGDWVKLGVAKRHGAVLGDAVSKMADENTKVQLVESNIPGAELHKPAEFCTVAILKRWLSCRGAKVSRNWKDLLKRLDYEPCNVNYFETIVTFAIEVNSLQTAVLWLY